ncbi:MAG: hypothetical protein EBU85_03050 [Actinobacteria bacterium]|nr:hypothetical protein [Actinomycetota bacterium]
MGRRKENELDAQEALARQSLARVTADLKSIVDAAQAIPVTWSSPVISEYVSDQARGWAARAGADASKRWARVWKTVKSRGHSATKATPERAVESDDSVI